MTHATDAAPTLWLNDRLVDAADAAVPVSDHGLTVGDGVFETMRVADGAAFALTRHLDRLTRSSRGLGLPDPDLDLVRRACDAVLAANPLPPETPGRLRVTYTGGPGPQGSERGRGRGTLLVTLGLAPVRPGATPVVTVPWVRNERSPLVGLKTTSYAENVVMLAYATERGGSEGLFANTRGHLCEGTASNVFVAVDGRLLTPALSSGCLAGITRALVLEWVGAEEAELPLSVLQEADEVFLTSSLRGVQGVSRVDERELPAPGPLTTKAAEVFAANAAQTVDA